MKYHCSEAVLLVYKNHKEIVDQFDDNDIDTLFRDSLSRNSYTGIKKGDCLSYYEALDSIGLIKLDSIDSFNRFKYSPEMIALYEYLVKKLKKSENKLQITEFI